MFFFFFLVAKMTPLKNTKIYFKKGDFFFFGGGGGGNIVSYFQKLSAKFSLTVAKSGWFYMIDFSKLKKKNLPKWKMWISQALKKGFSFFVAWKTFHLSVRTSCNFKHFAEILEFFVRPGKNKDIIISFSRKNCKMSSGIVKLYWECRGRSTTSV